MKSITMVLLFSSILISLIAFSCISNSSVATVKSETPDRTSQVSLKIAAEKSLKLCFHCQKGYFGGNGR